MKELTALDIFYLTKELQVLINSKIDQIYQPKYEILIRIHSPQFGKKILRISKNFIFLSDFKGEQEQNPRSFCMSLRKHIRNLRIRSIEQISFERVIKFKIEGKEKIYHLFFELFAKGNAILTDENNKIISLTHTERSKNIFTGQIYCPPEKEFNIITIKENEFKKVIKNSNETIVKTLAITFGLGGLYSEYILENLDKNIVSNELKIKEISKIFKRIKQIITNEIIPSYINNRIVPFKTDNPSNYKTFNEAIDKIITKDLKEEEENKIYAPFIKKKLKIENIISKQTEAVNKLESQIINNKIKGEIIYNNYQIINQILTQLNKARKTMSWKEIKNKLKDHKIIKNINEKNSTIELDLKE